MFQAILNIFKIADLRTKVLFTVGMLAVYRIGFWIPVPGINQEMLAETFQRARADQERKHVPEKDFERHSCRLLRTRLAAKCRPIAAKNQMTMLTSCVTPL